MGADRVLAHNVGHPDAVRWGVAGIQPADAVVTARKPHGEGVLYVSDRPYGADYNARPLCVGQRRDGHACQAKARVEGTCCEAHVDQEG